MPLVLLENLTTPESVNSLAQPNPFLHVIALSSIGSDNYSVCRPSYSVTPITSNTLPEGECYRVSLESAGAAEITSKMAASGVVGD